MNGKLPRISAQKLIKAVGKLGFILARQSGSHMIFKNDRGVRIVVPYHAKGDIHPKIIKGILKDLDMTVEEFKEYL